MRASDLDRRVDLLRATVAEDDQGDEVTTWSPIATVWAAKADLSDRERILAAQVATSVTTRFRLRWSSLWSGLDTQDRLRCEGRLYDIVGAPKEIGRREGLEITACARAERPAP